MDWSLNLNETDLKSTANEGPMRIQYKCLVPIYVFPEMKLLFPKQNYSVLSPSCYTHIYVRDLYISGSVCLFCCREIQYVDRSWEYINRSQTHACGNWDWGRAIPRKITHKWYFPCSAGLITGWLTSSSKLVSMIHIGNSMTTASPTNALQGWWETRDLILLPETHTHACKLNPQGSSLREKGAGGSGGGI